jgi:hypothetical protein
VEFKNLGIQLSNYTITRVMKQLDGAQTGQGIVFKEEASKRYYVCLVFSLYVLHSVYVFDFNLLFFSTVRLMGVLEI